MDDKSLAGKAVDIKGKQYVLVSDRVLYFNEKYEQGCITTELVSQPDANRVIIKATVYPDGVITTGPQADIHMYSRSFTGYSQAVIGDGYINKTSALENAETSAVGRALAFMGIGVIDSVASADELQKASTSPKTAPGATKPAKVTQDRSGISLADKKKIADYLKRLGKIVYKDTVGFDVKELTGLELIPEATDQIISRLASLVAEKEYEQ